MRKSLFLLLAMLISSMAFSQTRNTFISEHFDGNSLPSGWYVTGDGTGNNWIVYPTNMAGGDPNELIFAWYPIFEGTSRLVMPAADLTGVSNVKVSIRSYLDNNTGSNTIGIATSSDNGVTWNEGWSQTFSETGSYLVNETITTSDMGHDNVLFCLYFTGNSFDIYDWYFDDIEIYSIENLDVSLLSIDMRNHVGAGDKTVKCTISNKGIADVNDITMSYLFDGCETVEETFEVNLAPSDSTQLSFSVPTNLYPGDYSLTVNINAINGVDDDDPSNNILTKDISVLLGDFQKIPMIEHFSSSTCAPCVDANVEMDNLTRVNPGKFTYTKYPMNFPGAGDPYCIQDGIVRSQYYGVYGVPQVYLDGDPMDYNLSIAQFDLDEHYNTPATTEVRGSFNIDGSTITVKVDFMSMVDLESKAFVSVNEKQTEGNVGSNGETSFHHILMKMLTDASGDNLNIMAGNYQHFEYVYDLSATNVEEMEDLEVAAWIQDYPTKKILNSHYLYAYTDTHPYPVQNLTFAKINDEILKASWDTPEGGNALSYNVYLGGDFIVNTHELEFTTAAHDGIFVLAVEAVYENEMTSVSRVKVLDSSVGIEGHPQKPYDIYPNPTDGHLTINGKNIETVEIYDVFGQLSKVVKTNAPSVNISMNNLTSGVYMIRITDCDGNTTLQKVVKQ